MISDLSKLCIQPDASIGEAMSRLNAGGLGCLLLVDGDGRLKRLITDGDLRRELIAGTAMQSDLTALPDARPFTLHPGGTEDEARSIM